MAAEAVRHACASSAIDPNSTSSTDSYPDPGCAPARDPDRRLGREQRAGRARRTPGGRFATGRLAGVDLVESPVVVVRRAAHRDVLRRRRRAGPTSVQVWNVDGSLAAHRDECRGPDFGERVVGRRQRSGHDDEANRRVERGLREGDGRLGVGCGVGVESVGASADEPGEPARSPPGVVGERVDDGLARARARQGRRDRVRRSEPASRRAATVPASVAMNADGSLVAVLVNRGGDDYSLVPIDVATGKAGVATNIGNFATPLSSFWSNPPMVSAGETVDPPALWFAPGGSMVWVYNNERHVGVEVRSDPSGPPRAADQAAVGRQAARRQFAERPGHVDA